MADDSAGERAPSEDRENGERRVPSWIQQNRALALALGCLGLCGVIAVDVHFMLRADARRESAGGAPDPKGGSSSVESPPLPAAPSASSAAAPANDEATDSGEQDYESDDGEPRQPNSKPSTPSKHLATVQQAAVDSCTTASVDGLSRQIIAQARCIKPNAYVPLPTRPNLSVKSQVFPYLELDARDHLLKALDARPQQKMTINSALRTVAQQYLVWRWSATKRCGVPLATAPGESNHEIGVALDVAEAGSWRPLLEAQQFRWLGASDRVHFDYKPGASNPNGPRTDVLAFQKLWNRNNPNDKLTEDGRYSPAVEQRLKQSPPDGFALGPSCSKPAPK